MPNLIKEYQSIMGTKACGLVICETDIEMAIDFISRHPGTYPNRLPSTWTRQVFLKHLAETVREELEGIGVKKLSHKTVKGGISINLHSNIYAHIEFVASDLVGIDHDENNYQLYLSIRPVSTDPNKLESLNIFERK